MKKSLLWIVIALVVVALGGIGLYFYLGSPTKAPTSTPPTPPPAAGKAQAPLAEPNQPATESVTLAGKQARYEIVSARSSATFTLDEMLRGEPKTVVGTSTGAIYGEIGVNKDNLASSTIGTILLNARTFVTDDPMRNNAIRRLILKTEDDANEFIVFKTTSITGPDTDVPGIFDITGDLTIAGVTKPATFRAIVTIDKEGTLTARVTTIVKRGDFNLEIPNFPFLANIEETVELALNIVAQPKP